MAADDLTVIPSYPVEMTPQYKTIISTGENGVEQRRSKWSAPIRAWKLVYENISSSDVGTLLTFFTTYLGQYGSFLWTNPIDSTQYTVRLASDQPVVRRIAYGIYYVEFPIVQVK